MSLDKPALRKEMARRRAEAAAATDPAPALQLLEDHLADCDGPISFFWPIRTEIDPRPVMESLSKRERVCLPVTHGLAPLSFRQWQPGAVMDVDGFGVAIPHDGAEVIPRTLVIPLLGFDRHGQRLGYGAGHYDRTLAGLKAHGPVRSIGFAYAAQQLDADLPAEPTDQPLDVIVTESGLIRPNRTR